MSLGNIRQLSVNSSHPYHLNERHSQSDARKYPTLSFSATDTTPQFISSGFAPTVRVLARPRILVRIAFRIGIVGENCSRGMKIRDSSINLWDGKHNTLMCINAFKISFVGVRLPFLSLCAIVLLACF
ncbi:hypothetical protein TNCT_103631 [Trichonephila clavata]|uniref:Uncharacterized protein n=1 Tax=Trichonephila clavata TaxID=2740835 RepID=A0A8X6G7G4_TRICU|nr:hypothetical protein TNCT_103631 [Trichonephila clavata]